MKRLAYLGLLGQEGEESEEVVFEIVLLKPKIVFDTRLEWWRLKHGDVVLDSGLGCDADETTTLSMLYITGLEHEDSDAGAGSAGSRPTFRFASAVASSNETGLLPEESCVSFALMMWSVRSETSLKPVPRHG